MSLIHKKHYSLWETMKRMTKKQLIVPLIRSPHPPEYKARGVAVGLAWAMTPLVGIQMTTVLITWFFFNKLLKWTFSLPLAIAWTWVTNVFTMIPCYYIFYVTGQILRGRLGSISGYQNLEEIIKNTFLTDLTFTEKWTLFFELLLEDWGVSMAIGCLPWAVVIPIIGYKLTLRFEKARQERRLKKAQSQKLKQENTVLTES